MSPPQAHLGAQPASTIPKDKHTFPKEVSPAMRLSQAFDAYVRVRSQEGFSPYTITGYRWQWRALVQDVGDIEITDVTLETFRNHLSKQTHLKASSIAVRVRSLKSIFKWLYEEEYLPKNPTMKLKEPKLPKRVPKALTVDEMELLRDSCRTEREHALVELFFATGCRLDEIHRLNRNDIDWDRKAVVVFGKGSKEREVYFGAKASIWLKRYQATRQDEDPALFTTVKRPLIRLSKHQIEWVFGRIANRCGLKSKVTPHALRHTLATQLLNQGAPLVVVQTILGHEKPETTQLYAHLSGAARQQAYNRYFVQ